MQITHTDEEIHAKAVQLGLIQDGDELPRAMRGKVLAALLREQPKAAPAAEPALAAEIVVQPGGQILVDGEPFPWLVAKQPMEIGLDPDGISTVRMTLLAKAVQIIKPEPKEEPR
jgi:hypothetical protein